MLMTKRDAALLGDLGDGGGLAGVERADEELRALGDQALGARARDVDVRLGIAVHDVEAGQAELGQHLGRDLDAAMAILADARLHARARQEHAHAQPLRLRTHDAERRECGSDARGSERPVELTALHVFLLEARYSKRVRHD